MREERRNDEYLLPFSCCAKHPPPTPLSVAWLKGLEEASQHLGEAEVSANEQQNLEIGGQFENAPPSPYALFLLACKRHLVWERVRACAQLIYNVPAGPLSVIYECNLSRLIT